MRSVPTTGRRERERRLKREVWKEVADSHKYPSPFLQCSGDFLRSSSVL